ncbi:MAG TPA: hypothetical protein PKD95_04240 [Candidatus Paceibacterota bacterium]|nr:hypothetical protein [Candidatus Paceibacterota bacterium]
MNILSANYRRYLLLLIGLFFFLSISSVNAANFSVSPLIIDIQAEARDSAEYKLTLTNHDKRAVRLYASVNEITLGENSEIKTFVPASMSDRSISPTSWIEISRARIDVNAGEQNEIPLIIKINHNTPAGLYHAYVGFSPGANRDEAEAKILAGQGSGVVLRFAIGSKKEEYLRLVSFATDRFNLFSGDSMISYVLENTGDVALVPSGDVIIYDGRGQEVAVVDLSHDGSESIAPGEQRRYTADLPYTGKIGKNKAFLSLTYGIENKASLYDTYFYYSIPWYYLLLIVLLFALVIAVILLLVRKNNLNQITDSSDEAQDLPLFVAKRNEHNVYDHDIDLKNKTK